MIGHAENQGIACRKQGGISGRPKRTGPLRELKQGWIHGNPVADNWAGAVMQKTLGI